MICSFLLQIVRLKTLLLLKCDEQAIGSIPRRDGQLRKKRKRNDVKCKTEIVLRLPGHLLLQICFMHNLMNSGCAVFVKGATNIGVTLLLLCNFKYVCTIDKLHRTTTLWRRGWFDWGHCDFNARPLVQFEGKGIWLRECDRVQLNFSCNTLLHTTEFAVTKHWASTHGHRHRTYGHQRPSPI